MENRIPRSVPAFQFVSELFWNIQPRHSKPSNKGLSIPTRISDVWLPGQRGSFKSFAGVILRVTGMKMILDALYFGF